MPLPQQETHRSVVMIKLIAGLGNPGKDYQAHRHNAGFWFIDSLANNLDSKFSSQSKFRSEERRVGKECRSRWSPYH